ncbi:S-layer homology domain-containing protein [Thermophilibacter mediterraneus]|uniref:S-layer homology domain-containing protein n=1 Tax=Thermophilibacter mediterraneus TaxID=1871031 RepID=UPI0009315744|nr:S-layer homology domain-containing protein [Thermophilibacter mediterraneus]
MTACTNNGGSRARRAVTAALVGVLSVGAAPMVALATGAAPASGDVSLQVATDPSSVEDGTIVRFEGSRQEGDTFVANGKGQGLIPTKVQPFGTTDINSRVNVVDWVVYKLSDSTGNLSTSATDATKGRTIDGKAFYYETKLSAETLPTEVGEYAVFANVMVGSTKVYVSEGATFSIEAAKLSDATLYQVNASDTDDLSDTTYTFNTGNWQLTNRATSDLGNVAGFNRLALKVGNTQLDMSQFTFDYYTKAGKQVAGNDIVNAGDYYVIVSGISTGDYKTQKQRFDFTIAPYDVAQANIVAEDKVWSVTGGDTTKTTLATIDGVPYGSSWLSPFISLDYPNVATTTGPASVTVNVNASALKDPSGRFDYTGSIINSQVVNYNVVSAIATTDAFYGTTNFSAKTIATDYSDEETEVFDASKVSVSYTNPKDGKKVDTDAYTLRVVNTVTNEVGGVEMLANSGSYTVEAVLDSEALDYAVAGRSAQMKVTVTKGAIASTDVAFAWNDDIVTTGAISDQYVPGRDLLDEITVTVRTDNGVVPSSDYEVVVTDAKGDQVDEIVEPGTYRVQVVADGYTISETDSRLSVTVAKRNLAATGLQVRAKNTLNWESDDNNNGNIDSSEIHRALVYTGDVLTPSYEWSLDGKTWYDLPADEVTLTYFKKGDTKEVDLKNVGYYDVLVEAKGGSAHYTNEKSGVEVEVTDRRVFADVPSDAFYAQSVYQAADQGYIGGIGGTNLFAPMNSITRADVACVLYRMAGGSIESSKEDLTNEQIATISRFIDVDKNAYYARAVAWGVEMGIMNGYGDTFGSARNITTEEFVTMLARYAEKMGTDTAVDTDAVLASVSDGDEVSGYARDAVAWAVSEGYIAKGGNSIAPQENVARWRTVMIAVDFQPTQLDVITDNPNADTPGTTE